MYWADSIKSIRKHHPNKDNWKQSIFFFNTMINALNLWIIFIWLKILDIINIPLLHIDILSGTGVDSFLAFALEFASPFLIINYFFVFFRNRYKRFIDKYEDYQGKVAGRYGISIILLTVFSLYIWGMTN